MKENVKKIDNLEQYSILRGCHDALTGADVSNQVFEDFLFVFLYSKLNLPTAVTHSDYYIAIQESKKFYYYQICMQNYEKYHN